MYLNDDRSRVFLLSIFSFFGLNFNYLGQLNHLRLFLPTLFGVVQRENLSAPSGCSFRSWRTSLQWVGCVWGCAARVTFRLCFLLPPLVAWGLDAFGTELCKASRSWGGPALRSPQPSTPSLPLSRQFAQACPHEAEYFTVENLSSCVQAGLGCGR